MRQNLQEKGQALILITFAAIGLFAFAALAIDGSRAFSNKRHAQNAADTAVLTAALASVRCAPPSCNPADPVARFAAAETAARARATGNGFTDNGDTIIVDVDLCSNTSDINPVTHATIPDTPCEGVEPGKEAEYMRVKIISSIPSTFGRVIGRQNLTSAAEAIARVQGSSSTASSPGNAVVALRKSGCGLCGTGVGRLVVNGSGIFSNSSGATQPGCSINITGTGYYQSEQGFTMATGGALCKPNGGLAPVIGNTQYATQLSTTYNIPAPNIACSNNAPPINGSTVSPGRYTGTLTLNSQSTYTLQPGNYCLENGLIINGGINVNASGVNFIITGGEFATIGHANLTCNNTMFYVAGGTGVHLNGTGSTNCTGATFYMQTGNLTWNGTSTQVLRAPTAGTYKGLLIYIPEGNGSELKINGTSSNDLVGSVIAPGSHVVLSGVSGSSGYNTQIIGSYIDILGTSNTVINYDPNAQYNPPSSPTIQLTK